MEQASPEFRIWVRRDNDPRQPFSIRFEVDQGRGVLRISQDGMLVDGPAASHGEEHGLAIEPLRASRFLLVWGRARSRLSFALTGLDPDELSVLERGHWYPLTRLEGADVLELSPLQTLLPAEAGPDESVETTLSSVDARLPTTSLGYHGEDTPLPAVDALGEGAATQSTALVRHLRRSLAQERARAFALEHRVRHLEDALRGAGLKVPPWQD